MSQVPRATILIVEDDRGIALLEQRRLERAGYQTVVAATAADALAHLAHLPIDLLLLDNRLPGNVSGLDLYDRLKREGHDLPVIVVTGFSDENTAIRALRMGVRDFVSKSPEAIEHLPEAVERVLKQATTEAALRASEAALRAVVDTAPDGIITIDERGLILSFNPAAERLFGYQAEEVMGRNIALLMPEPHRSRHDDYLTHYETTGEKRIIGRTRELEAQRKDGTIFPMELGVSEIVVGGRRHFTGLIHDLTARKRAEENLRAHARQQEAVAALGRQALTGATPEMLMARACPLVAASLGVDVVSIIEQLPEGHGLLLRFGVGFPPEAVGRYVFPADETASPSAYSLKHRHSVVVADLPTESRFGAPSLLRGTGVVSGITTLIQAGDRSWGVLSAYSKRPRDFSTQELHFVESVANVLSSALDRRRAEESLQRSEAQFRQAQKMEAVGRLAGGIAHDFNNLLTVINGYSEMLIHSLREGDPLRASLAEVLTAGERAALLTRQLLAFSRRQIMQPAVIDLNAILTNFERMLRRLIGEDIEFVTRLAPDLGRVKVDPGQIEQVVMNLAINARDAMPTGGRLEVVTENVVLAEPVGGALATPGPGRYVRLSVCDTGSGIPSEQLGQIFEPFFTTKEKGRGTGLGLSTVYGIIAQSNGGIEVESEIGRGTAFHVYLPLTEEEASAVLQSSGGLPRGHETILLVEDDDALRQFVQSVLQSCGYHLLIARHGEEAERLCRAYGDSIPLLLTDVVMPQMSGPRLGEVLLGLRPDLKVLYVSGYTDDALLRHGALPAGTAFLAKPFSPQSLARKVRDVLDGAV